jgi:hypothetical protein
MIKKQKVSPKKFMKVVDILVSELAIRKIGMNKKQLITVANFYGYVHQQYCGGVLFAQNHYGSINRPIVIDMRFECVYHVQRGGLVFHKEKLAIESFYAALMILRCRIRLPTHVIRQILCRSDGFIKKILTRYIQ